MQWRDDTIMWWQDDQMTGWPDDQMTEWLDDQMTGWPDEQMDGSPDDQMTKWPDDQMTEWEEASQTIDRMVYCLSIYLFIIQCRHQEVVLETPRPKLRKWIPSENSGGNDKILSVLNFVASLCVYLCIIYSLYVISCHGNMLLWGTNSCM